MVIKKGTLVCKSKLFAYVVSSDQRGFFCDYCLKHAPNLRRCTRCIFVYYCNKDCQKHAWKEHKQECLNIKRLLTQQNKIPSGSLLLMSRIIYKLQSEDIEDQVETIGTTVRRFSNLESHAEDIQKDVKRLEYVRKIGRMLGDFLPARDVPPFSDILDIFGKCQINGELIQNEDFENIGIGVYLGSSIFNHSCKPNATVTFDGLDACVYLTEDLPTLDYSKIFISYINLRATTQERKENLKDRYFFDCDCVRCLDVNDDKILTSFKCANENCDGSVVFQDGAWSCLKCAFVLDDERVNAAIESMNICSSSDLGPKLDRALDLNECQSYFRALEKILDSASTLLHPLNLHYVKMCEVAYYACLGLTLLKKALHFGKIIITSFRKCCGNNCAALGIMLLRMAKIANSLHGFDSARIYLVEAFEILDVTHGVSEATIAPYREWFMTQRVPLAILLSH